MSDLVATNGAVKEAAPMPFKTNSSINITLKRNKHEIEIDMDKLTWEDGKKIRKYQKSMSDGTMTEDEAFKLMDDIIEKVAGKHPDTMPMEVVNKIMAVLFADDADAVAAEGNSETA